MHRGHHNAALSSVLLSFEYTHLGFKLERASAQASLNIVDITALVPFKCFNCNARFRSQRSRSVSSNAMPRQSERTLLRCDPKKLSHGLRSVGGRHRLPRPTSEAALPLNRTSGVVKRHAVLST